MHIICRD